MEYYQEQTLQKRRKRGLTLLGAGLAIIAFVFLGYALYTSSQFQIVATDPPIDQFATYAPVLYVDFNQPLVRTGLSVTSNPNITPSFSVSGKRLTITIDPGVGQGQSYTITLSHIRSTSGATIPTHVFQFKGQYVPYDNLSSQLQKLLSSRQDQYPPLRNNIDFVGTDTLLNDGVSSEQLDAMEQAVFLFGQSNKITVSTAIIDENSVQPVPHDPNSASVVLGVNFNIAINRTPYSAQLQYSSLTTARLILYKQNTTTLVYDSGNIDDTTIN